MVALRRVTPAMPPLALDPVLFGDYQQLKRFFYLFGSGTTLARAAELVAADGMAFLTRLWQDWSPGYGAAEEQPPGNRPSSDQYLRGGQRARPRRYSG